MLHDAMARGEPPSIDAAAFDARLARSRFQLIGTAVQRMLLTHRLVDLFAAWMLWRLGLGAGAVAWFAASTALHGARWWQLRQWRLDAAPDFPRADRALAVHCLLQAAMWALLLTAAFTQPVGPEHQALTALCLGVAVDAVFTSGWTPAVFARWAALVGAALAAGWAICGGDFGIPIAALVVCFLFAMYGYTGDQYKAMRRRVGLRIENEQLTHTLRVERDRAEAASHARTRFLAAGSHDLRQPLHALSINATTLSLLAQRIADPLLLEVSDSISRALRHSNGVLDGLLDISRLDVGVVRPDLRDMDIAPVLEALRDEFNPIAAQRGLRLAIEVPADRDLVVRSDPDLLLRMLRHLVGNALKFTARGEVRVSAAMVRSPPASTRVLLSVADTGPGIPSEAHERVFEEFSQLGNPSRDRSQGLGLGLTIVRRISELLGSPLQMHSVPDEGTRMTLSLPAGDHAIAGVTKISAYDEAPPASVDDRPLQGLRVLAIDDEPEIVRSLHGLLTHLGGDARGAEGRDEAVALVKAGFRPDLIIADHRLRGHTGLEAIAAVCEHTGVLPALVVTGDTAPQALQSAMAGGYPVIHKPVDGLRLARALAAMDVKPAYHAQTAR